MIAATAGLMLTGCNKDDGADTAISHFPEDGVIRVTTNVNEAVLTRAGLTADNLQFFTLKIVTGDGSDAAYNYFRVMNDYSAGEWTPYPATPPMLWKDKNTPVSVSAAKYSSYEFTEADFSGVSLDLPEDQSITAGLGVNQADLLVQRATTVNPATDLGNDGKISITLSHALSKIDVTLTLADEFAKNNLNNAADLTDFTISSKGSFQFTPVDGTVSVEPNAEAISVKAYQSSYTSGTTSVANYECIVVPEASTTLTVSFKIGDKTYTWTKSGVELKQGYKYDLALNVGSDAVTVANDGISASSWTGQSDTPTDINTH